MILQGFGMMVYKYMSTPMVTNLNKLIETDSFMVDPFMYWHLISSLMHSVNYRPNIFFRVNTLSYLLVEPRNSHWIVENYVLIYLLGIVSYGWRYVPKYWVKLYEFSDSNWKGSIEDMKSTLGCCFSLGSTLIS